MDKLRSFEQYLIDRHAEQYDGLDDEMPDDCSDWISDLPVDQIIVYADRWMAQAMKEVRLGQA